ncbi:MAG: type II secretion system F family protein [Sciscionella sp.]
MNGQALAAAALSAAVLVDPAPWIVRWRLAMVTGRAEALHSGAGGGSDTARAWLVPAVAGLALGLLAGTLSGPPLGFGLGPLVGGCGLLAARKLLGGSAAVRRRKPVEPLRVAAAWDLLAACLSCGMPVPTAVRAVATGMPGAAATALTRTAELIALGADPVEAWAPALEDPATADLARGARRTARSGTALAGVAKGLAAQVRGSADDTAEAHAQRAAVLVSGPLALCFLPAFLCLGVVPVVIGLAEQLMRSW